jgi:cellulose biosynthesis protein BcsQ
MCAWSGRDQRGTLLTVPTSDPTLDVAENFREASLDALCAREGYSLVLLDSGPGDTALLDAMMATARYLLVPTMDDHASLKGLELIAARYVQARQAGARIDLLGVVLFGLNPRASRRNQAAMDTVDEMLEGSGAERFDTFIRHDKAAAVDLRARGLTPGSWSTVTAETSRSAGVIGQGERGPTRSRAWSRDPSKLAIDYRELAREVLRRIEHSKRGAAMTLKSDLWDTTATGRRPAATALGRPTAGARPRRVPGAPTPHTVMAPPPATAPGAGKRTEPTHHIMVTSTPPLSTPSDNATGPS